MYITYIVFDNSQNRRNRQMRKDRGRQTDSRTDIKRNPIRLSNRQTGKGK